MRRAVLPVVAFLLAACASQPQRPPGQIEILSTTRGQPLAGARCAVDTGAGSWTVQTPATVNVGEPRGDLRVVCQRDGYRSSEVVIRGGAGGYGPGASRVGVGVGSGIGAGSGIGFGSGVGLSLGFGFPLASARSRYPAQVVVDMVPLDPPQ